MNTVLLFTEGACEGEDSSNGGVGGILINEWCVVISCFSETESHAGSVGFLRVLFFHLFFYFVFFIAKIPRFISKQKNQSCEKNLGQVHSGLFLCIFLFLFGFFVVPSPTVQKHEVFAVPSPTVQKLEENQKNKKNKKNNPVRRILGKSIQDCFFWFIWFFSRFWTKTSRKTK